MSIGELWKIKRFLWREQFRVIFSFYPRFALIDLALSFLYFFSNPFRICRRFLQKRGRKNIYAYGETPLTLFATIAELKPDDLFIDLGCGRGRLCFWSSAFIGCKTIGVDFVPAFIQRARLCASCFRLPATFLCCSISDIPLEEATVLYLYTYHRDEKKIDFQRLKRGARVITVSEPLMSELFFIKAMKKGVFPWGETEIYINCRI